MESHDLSYKELPTRELKLRRTQERRDSPPFPHIKLRIKDSLSPVHCTDIERSCSDRSMSSSPEGISLHLSPNSAFRCYNKYIYKVDPLVSPPVVTEASSTYRDPHSPSYEVETDSDQPLDMSTKRLHVQQQQRPSVITCASALLRTHCSSDHRICNLSYCTSDNSNDSDKSKDVKVGHRREVVAGSCDPVIDEHFRRSLGKDYQQIFSKASTNSVSITVDDHFAKALGDTWLQLQQSDPDSPPQPPADKHHAEQQSHFLSLSHEIVSS